MPRYTMRRAWLPDGRDFSVTCIADGTATVALTSALQRQIRTAGLNTK